MPPPISPINGAPKTVPAGTRDGAKCPGKPAAEVTRWSGEATPPPSQVRRRWAITPSLPAAVCALLLMLLGGWLLAPASRLGRSLAQASYDWSQALSPQPSLTNTPVVIVYLDLDSYLRENQNPAAPWSRALHAELLRRLTAAGAKAVVFDIIFDAPGTDVWADRAFTNALRANGRVVLAAEISRSSRQTPLAEGTESMRLELPAPSFLHAAAAWGIANARVDDDFVVRRQFGGLPGLPGPDLALATARLLHIAETNPPDRWIRYYGKPLAISHVSYSAALRADEVAADFFRDRIVLIGARPMAGTFLERKDEFRSPLAAWGDPELFMPAVEVHATQLLNLIRADSLRRLSPGEELLVLVLTAGLLSGLLFHFRPLAAAGMALVAEGCVFGASAHVMSANKIWFPWLLVGAVQIPVALAGSVLCRSLEWYRQKQRLEAGRRIAEAKIREQATLIEKAQDAILVENLAGQIIYANPGAERLYGWSLAELQSHGPPRIMAAGEPRLAAARQTAVATGEWLGELEQFARDGQPLIVASRCTLIHNERNEPKSLLFINTDVTEKKRLEAEYFRSQRIESIGAIAGGMAHDLNNALAPVLMGLQLLQKQPADEETHRMLSVMEKNTQRGADMVRQVLLFSRGRDGEKEPLSLVGLMGELERILRQTFPKSINIAALVPADLWPVTGNATRLHQVLLNLCVNARDAMPSGGALTLAADNVALTDAEAREIPNAAPGPYVLLIVSDTGSGIAPEVLPRIFEPFFTTKPAGQGTGLGLSIASRIISQHGGLVRVRSELGRGTTFEIYLPRAVVPVSAMAAPEAPAKAPPGGNNEMILVADDEESVREMVSLGLTTHGYRVITAANGAEAIAQCERHAPEVRLILLDTDMPILSGQAAIPHLRNRAAAVPIVLMSGEATAPADGSQTARLAKPFQLHELLSIVSAQILA